MSVKAIAIAVGFEPSEVSLGTYTINVPAAKALPVSFDPPGGTYSADVTVKLSTASAGGWICYRLDGLPASCGSDGTAKFTCGTGATLYATPLPITPPATIRARACLSSCIAPSEETSATYTKG